MIDHSSLQPTSKNLVELINCLVRMIVLFCLEFFASNLDMPYELISFRFEILFAYIGFSLFK